MRAPSEVPEEVTESH